MRRTHLGTQVKTTRTTTGTAIELSTPGNVIAFPRKNRDLDWLMRAVSSTPYAETRS